MYYTQFESRLKKTLYEFNTDDTRHHIIWSLHKVPIDEAPIRSARFCLKIYITELDNNEEELPTYQQTTSLLLQPPPPSYELSLIRQPQTAILIH